MCKRCAPHTQAILELLKPDIVIAQGGHPRQAMIDLFEPTIVLQGNNGYAGKHHRDAALGISGDTFVLLTAHPANHAGFATVNGPLPTYLSELIEEMKGRFALR